MASVDPMPKPIYSDEVSGQEMNPKLVIEKILKDLSTTYQYSAIEQVFMGVLPTYSPSNSPIYNETVGVHHACKDCGDKFVLESSLRLHEARVVVTIEHRCADCSRTLTFHNRCNFLAHLRGHNFDPGSADFGSIEFSLKPAPRLGGVAGGGACRPDEEGDSNCSSGSSGFASEDVATPTTFRTTPTTFKDTPTTFIDTPTTFQDTPTKFQAPPTSLVDPPIQAPPSIFQAAPTTSQATPTSIVAPPTTSQATPTSLVAPPTTSQATPTTSQATPPAGKCPECHLSPPSLAAHYRGGDRPPSDPRLACDRCPLVLPTRCSLKAHRRIHSLVGPFVCPECGLTFNSWPTLRYHLSRACFHLLRRVRHCCQLCSQLFGLASSLHKHISLSHTGVDIYPCPQCNNTSTTTTNFNSKRALRQHLALVHGVTDKHPEPFKSCQLCSETVPKRGYISHVFKHCLSSGRYAYECVQCGDAYLTRDMYAKHRETCGQVDESASTNHATNTDMESTKNNMEEVLESAKTQPSDESKNGLNKTRPGKAYMMEYRSFRCKQCDEIVDLAKDSLQQHLALKHKDSKSIVFQPVQKALACDQRLCLEEDKNEGIDGVEDANVRNAIPKRKRKVSMSNGDDDDDDYEPPRKDSVVCGAKSASPRPKRKSKPRSMSPPQESLTKPREKPVEAKPRARKQFKSAIVRKSAPYSCRDCPFVGDEPDGFRKHIVGHRSPRDFQCMECGCRYVTKPSLRIHLVTAHKIRDLEAYMASNDCCEQPDVASKPREEETQTPLVENQCSICRAVCESALHLDKHFRTHGMAYLLTKMRQRQNAASADA